MSKDTYRYQGDRREGGRRSVEAQEHTLASPDHENRNEDAALGDVARIRGELEDPPDIVADAKCQSSLVERPELAKLAQANAEAIREYAEAELAVAEQLKDKTAFGVFDGVSGAFPKKSKLNGMGAGAVASRIASANFAERMAALPPDATVDQTKEALREAFRGANTDIADHKTRNSEFAEDLTQMGCTADVLKAIDNGDGTHEVVYGHVGDSRIYVLDGKTGELRQETRDDSLLETMVQQGKISEREAGLISQADRKDLDGLYKALPDKNPQFLKQLVDYRQAIVKSVSGQEMEPTVGSFRVNEGDKVLISSDGIHDNVPAERIAEIMRAGGGAKELAEEAYRRAGGGGAAKAPDAKGPDDITLQVLEFGGERREAAAETTKLDIRPENFDAAVEDARARLEAVPSAAEVGPDEHERQKYAVLSELSEFLTSQLNAEKDPAKRERALRMSEELAGNGPEKRLLGGLQIANMRAEARKHGRPEPPMIDMQGAAWLQQFEQAGWSTEQVKAWIDQRRNEIDAEVRGAMDADPSMKRLAEAHRDLAAATKEMRKLGTSMEERQKARDRAALDKARTRVSNSPVMMMDGEEVRKMREEAERQIKEREQREQQQQKPAAKKPWWKIWK